MVAVFIQPRCRNRPVDRGGRRGLCTCCPPIAQRMGRTSHRFRRLDCGHCRRRILVYSTSIFPRRYFMRRGILLGALLAIFVLSMTLAGLQIRDEIKAGKSVDAASAEYKIPEKYKGYQISTFLGGIKNNVQVAYNELGKKYAKK